MKTTLRIIGLFIIGIASIFGVYAYQEHKDYVGAKYICSQIKAFKTNSEILALAKNNNWYARDYITSTKVSMKKYGCFCLFTHKDDKVINIYGALCQD